METAAQGCQSFPSTRPKDRLVRDAKHDNGVGKLRWGDELGRDLNVAVLGVCVARITSQEGDGAFLPQPTETYTREGEVFNVIDTITPHRGE